MVKGRWGSFDRAFPSYLVPPSLKPSRDSLAILGCWLEILEEGVGRRDVALPGVRLTPLPPLERAPPFLASRHSESRSSPAWYHPLRPAIFISQCRSTRLRLLESSALSCSFFTLPQSTHHLSSVHVLPRLLDAPTSSSHVLWPFCSCNTISCDLCVCCLAPVLCPA